MVRGRGGAFPRLVTSRSFGVPDTRAWRILMPGRLRQAIGFGLITLEDFSLTGQIPTLFRPWVHRRVVRFMVACLRSLYVSHLYLLSEYCAEHARQRSPRRYGAAKACVSFLAHSKQFRF